MVYLGFKTGWLFHIFLCVLGDDWPKRTRASLQSDHCKAIESWLSDGLLCTSAFQLRSLQLCNFQILHPDLAALPIAPDNLRSQMQVANLV